MSVLWTPLRLVMEENDHKDVQPTPTTASILRHEKNITTISKIVTNKQIREKGAGDYCYNSSNKELGTLPFRTELLRARFQEKINEGSKLTTTALVERPRSYKAECEQKKRNFIVTTSKTPVAVRAITSPPVDTPDDASIPPVQNGDCRHYHRDLIGNADSKDRPLIVNLPDQNKNIDNLNFDDNNVNNQKTDRLQSNNLPQKKVDKELDLDQNGNDKEDEEKDDCLVNCIYYTQQFCDCTIL